ncbi:MAG: efflux RND transporter periplasmic adaptor subunit [Deltaproteobacteria bacterium]|nr:efflux RND transporter periplasmic adaptor subunit [Deltaproteobacteria bacterium]
MYKQLTKLCLFLLFLLISNSSIAATAGNDSPTSNLQIRSTSFNQSYPGTVLASSQAQLAFRVSGPLITVTVKPGDCVKKGQLLMQIDPRDFEDNIRVLEAQLSGAKSQQDRARRDFDRAKTLFEQHVNATADFDRSKSSFDSALSSVESIKAQLQIARHQLKDTSLLAPYAGVITIQSAENFEMVRTGQVVFAIQDISTLEVEIKIPENEIARRPLQSGQQVSVELPAIPNRTFAAKLVEWNTAADPITRTYALRFTFIAPTDVQVLPGMSAEVSIVDEDTRVSSFCIPELRNTATSATL